MKMSNNIESIEIPMDQAAVSDWNYLLQKGFALKGMSGMSVREFLHQQLEFDDEFIESEVRTVFLNFSPVDNLDETHIKDGDKMALGSAMPGLVGIVMGRDNFYKSFRSGIAAKADEAGAEQVPVTLSVKVFSTLAVASGRKILERGILIDAAVLATFLKGKQQFLGDDANVIERVEGETGLVPIRVRFV